MLLTRVNEMAYSRPGEAPEVWTNGPNCGYDVVDVPGWLDDGTAHGYHWYPNGGDGANVSTAIPGLTPGQRYCWALRGSVDTDGVQLTVFGTIVTLPTGTAGTVGGTFVATGNDVFEIACAGAWPSQVTAVFESVMVEENVVAGTAGRLFDGDLPGARWTSTPWRSTSTLTCDIDPWTLEPLSGFPAVVVQAAARPPASWAFTLDSSQLDGSAVLYADPRWVELPTATTFATTRGRTDPNAQVQAGTLTVTCDNFDGLLDPWNPTSPYRPNTTESYLARGMLVRICAVSPTDPLTFTADAIITGRVTDWDLGDGQTQQVTISAADDLSLLNGNVAAATANTRGGETTAARARWAGTLVAAVTVNASDLATRPLLPLTGGGTVRAVLDDAAAAEAGRAFADRTGVVRLTANADDVEQTVSLVLTDQPPPSPVPQVDYEQIKVSPGFDRIVNQVTVERGSNAPAGHQEVSAADLASIATHGVSSLSVTAPLQNLSQSRDLAAYLATRRSQPAEWVTAATVNLAGQDPAAAAICVGLELGDRVEVIRQIPYTTGARLLAGVYMVEGISHRAATDAWTVDLALAPIDEVQPYSPVVDDGSYTPPPPGGGGTVDPNAKPFTLDKSLLDGTDVLKPL